MSGEILCNDCLDTGWLEDREGRSVCACISETEPYQILKAENGRLRAENERLRLDLENCTQLLNEEEREAEQLTKMLKDVGSFARRMDNRANRNEKDAERFRKAIDLGFLGPNARQAIDDAMRESE